MRQNVLNYFKELSAVPRSSGEEKAISEYLMNFARTRGLEAVCDEAYNVVIRKPASPGYENGPVVMLQGHSDMVCEQNKGTDHDFHNCGLDLIEQDGFLRARGTTLGADNGVGVAMMLAILDDGEAAHPPLECVITSAEEIGLIGAAAMDKSALRAQIMINLDSEQEGIATVSCAGGMRVDVTREAASEEVLGLSALRLAVRGLSGGHSGTEIDRGRGNANKLMGRLLCQVQQLCPVRIASLSGGNKDNAIPRECDCVVLLPQENSAAAAELLRRTADKISRELAAADPGFRFECEPVAAPRQALSQAVSHDAIEFLFLAPDGPLHRDHSAGGFVVSSVNLGVVSLTEGTLSFRFSPRSSVESLQRETEQILTHLAGLLGFEAQTCSEYPGWAYEPKSRIRELFAETYRELTGGTLRTEAIHAGLECGLFKAAMPGLDPIAIGPNISGAHTPQETLDIASAERTYELVRAVLAKLRQA
ncbi:aminoacyl-histidine dipeptidase [Feifania hominis]|uniref:Cytosol non-specific dipeptidase n=1 Tax=Feifania hominis TaxID=2763660 RepID=A0A926DDL1_9FIRM|nr:aminoacyl-histidine dipeptidase [Feifania hominis]MBC8537010.1 aminoacyl-histidine dipeptidase [Feifania hominis]